MAEIWFISDTHFFHENILKFTNKDGKRIRAKFSSIEEMHETIINNWNAAVRPNDHIYHLGDVTFKYDGPFNLLMSRLNGHKRLVIGNHDKLKNKSLLKWFDKVMLWRGFKEHNFTCSHIPLRLDTLRDGQFNVHGHTHERSLADPHYINVSVECTDYCPVHLDSLLKTINR